MIPTTEQTETLSNVARAMFRIRIEIDCALHLPSEPNQGIEPTTYVSFEAFAQNANEEIATPNSIVYTTDVIECSSSPQWNKQYKVSLPVDFLTDVRMDRLKFSFTRLLFIICINFQIRNLIVGSETIHSSHMAKK